jgi:archaellum biogenesis ATPase FlaH
LKSELWVSQFAKLTATLRQVPSTRQRFVNRLLDRNAANESWVVIVDNLDHFIAVAAWGKGTQSEILSIAAINCAANCHVIYHGADFTR